MSAATRSHDDRTMTSTPPIEPILKAPGSFRSAGAPSPVLCATWSTYRTCGRSPGRRVVRHSVGGVTYCGWHDAAGGGWSPDGGGHGGRRDRRRRVALAEPGRGLHDL